MEAAWNGEIFCCPPSPSNVRQKNSVHIDRGLSGGSSVRRPGSEDPHRCERKYLIHYIFSPVWRSLCRGYSSHWGALPALASSISATEPMLLSSSSLLHVIIKHEKSCKSSTNSIWVKGYQKIPAAGEGTHNCLLVAALTNPSQNEKISIFI